MLPRRAGGLTVTLVPICRGGCCRPTARRSGRARNGRQAARPARPGPQAPASAAEPRLDLSWRSIRQRHVATCGPDKLGVDSIRPHADVPDRDARICRRARATVVVTPPPVREEHIRCLLLRRHHHVPLSLRVERALLDP